MRCSAQRSGACTADPGPRLEKVSGPRVCSAPLRAALRPGNALGVSPHLAQREGGGRAIEHQVLDLADGNRPAEEIALRFLAAFLAQEREVLLALDALGEDRDRQALAEPEHGAH